MKSGEGGWEVTRAVKSWSCNRNQERVGGKLGGL